ncbi:hypothetical protein MIR68_002640 [Amoeboaphelidium protococcarum]|nr:hypothetical protein MIR68_002640 [Amoeboaphelidium protococcarum]
MQLSRNATTLLLSIMIDLGVRAQSVPSTCGNGQVDSGEQCDPSAQSFSSECCTSQCQFAPEYSQCQFGNGVCNRGQCSSRASQCSVYDGTYMQFEFPVQPGNISNVRGPFSVCSADSAPSSSSSSQQSVVSLINGGGTSQSSLLPQLLSADSLAQSKCSPACQGTGSNGSPFCTDFTQFRNLPVSVADFLPCISDQTQGVAVKDWYDALQSGADNNDDQQILDAIQEKLQVGVCVNGSCRVGSDQICRQRRCSNQGECVLSASAQNFLLGVMGISYEVQAGNQTSTSTSAVQCKCDDGFGGVDCSQTTAQDSSNEDQSNDRESAAVQGFVPKSQYESALIGATIGSFFGALIMAGCLCLCWGCFSRSNKKKRDQEAAALFYAKNGPYDPMIDDQQNVYAHNGPSLHDIAVVNADSHEDDGSVKPIRVDDFSGPDANGMHNTEKDFDHLLSIGDHALATASSSNRGYSIGEEEVDIGTLPVNGGFQSNSSPVHDEFAQADTLVNQQQPMQEFEKSYISDLPLSHIYSMGAGHALVDAAQSQPQAGSSNKTSMPPPLPQITVSGEEQNYLRASHTYTPRLADELELLPGDVLYLIKTFDDGWAKAYNMRSGNEGIFPMGFVKKVTLNKAQLEEGQKNMPKSMFQNGVLKDDAMASSEPAGSSEVQRRSSLLKNSKTGKK